MTTTVQLVSVGGCYHCGQVFAVTEEFKEAAERGPSHILVSLLWR